MAQDEKAIEQYSAVADSTARDLVSPGSSSTDVALRMSARRLRAIIEAEPECVKIVSDQGWLLEMNPAGLAMIEAASLSEAQSRPLLEFIAPEHRAAFAELHRKVMSGEEGALRFETIGLKGARRWLETRAVPLPDEAGKVRELLGVTRDVTERVHSERRSADEYRILELVAKDAPLHAVLEALCKSLEAQLASGASCSILLLDGVHLRHGAAPSLPQRYVRSIDGVAVGPAVGSCGTAAYSAKQIIVADIATDPLWRDYRDLALREGLRACWSTPVLDDQAKVLATFAIYYRELRTPADAERMLIDRATYLASIAIERLRSHSALRESEDRFRQLAENIRETFWLTDPSKSQMLYISPAYEEIWGRSCDSLYQSPRSWLDSIHPEDHERVLQATTAKQARGDYDEEYRVVRPDGSIRWIRDRAFPVKDAHGTAYRIAGVAEDITERRRAEQALRDQATRLQRLSRRLREVEEAERRRISHELHDRIGQSLSALSLSVDLIRPELDKRGNKAAKLRLDAAQGLIETTITQVRDLMAELHPPALDDYGLFAALRHYADTFADGAGVPIAATGEDIVPRLAPDIEMALFRIAQEALVNAAKHSGARRIEVSLSAEAGKVTLIVADNGRGFDTTGLGTKRASWGLSIMRERAETIGAELRVESIPGRGTRVLVEHAR